MVGGSERMADVVETCSRCGKLIEGEPALVVVQSGPRAPAQPVINLCPACADSMSRWFARRRHAREPEPAAQHTERPADTSHRHRDHHHRRQRRRWRARRRRLIRGALAIAYVFVSFTILTFVVYQVWRLSLYVF
jgi:ribosome-binding protein aMBF1 (putative translation factor)